MVKSELVSHVVQTSGNTLFDAMFEGVFFEATKIDFEGQLSIG